MLTQRRLTLLAFCAILLGTAIRAHAQALASPDLGIFLGAEEAGLFKSRAAGTYVFNLSFAFPVSTVEENGRNVAQIGAWLDGAIQAVPSNEVVPVQEIVAGFAKPGSVSNVTRGIDLLGGIDIRVGQRRGTFAKRYRITSAITLAVGFSAPFDVPNRVSAFVLTPEASARFSVPSRPGGEYRFIAFDEERRAVNFQWYAGWRLKAFRFASERSLEQANYPGVLHLQLGQHKRLESADPFVYRVQAILPLAVPGLGRVLYVHGRLAGPIGGHRTREVALIPASLQTITPDVLYTYRLTAQDRSQHMWAVGISAELLTLLRNLGRD